MSYLAVLVDGFGRAYLTVRTGPAEEIIRLVANGRSYVFRYHLSILAGPHPGRPTCVYALDGVQLFPAFRVINSVGEIEDAAALEALALWDRTQRASMDAGDVA